jgi:hypothetical protein
LPRVAIATAAEECLVHEVLALIDNRLDGHAAAAEPARHVEFVGRALGDADRGAAQLGQALHVQLLGHHEALAVIEIDAGILQAEPGIALQRDGRVAHQHVDLAGLQRQEALLGGERHVLGLGRIAQHGGGDGIAQVDVEAGPLALAVGQRETAQADIDATNQLAALLDDLEGRWRLRRGGGDHEGERAESCADAQNSLDEVHGLPPLDGQQSA